MLCRDVIVLSGVLVLLAGCSGGENPQSSATPSLTHTLVQQAYVKASNTKAFSSFGGTIALDGNTMVVGAANESTGAQNSGAVYVFTRVGSIWTEQAFLKPSVLKSGEGFGGSIALSGNTLVVGAPALVKPSNPNGGTGTVYVFTRSGGTWTQQAELKASNAETFDEFGRSVDLEGNTLVVGAPGEDSALTGVIVGSPDEAVTGNGAVNSGAMYIFSGSGSTWTQQAYVKASNTDSGDGFGGRVVLAGGTLAVGASGEDSSTTGINTNNLQGDNGASDSGAVYIFTGSGATWAQRAYVKASNTEAGDRFGGRLALVNGTLAVGALGEDSSATGINNNDMQDDNGANDSGAVYIFTGDGAAWTQQAYVKASSTARGDDFGASLALIDGALAVGATGRDSRSGTVYVFTRNNGSWIQQASFKASNAEANDNFGGGLGLVGNTLNDATLAVGAFEESSNAKGINGDQKDNSESSSGAVYVLR